jgi:hypothetical protein
MYPQRNAGATPFERVLDSISPVAGAEVMGTAIVSIALTLDDYETLSRSDQCSATGRRRRSALR